MAKLAKEVLTQFKFARFFGSLLMFIVLLKLDKLMPLQAFNPKEGSKGLVLGGPVGLVKDDRLSRVLLLVRMVPLTPKFEELLKREV